MIKAIIFDLWHTLITSGKKWDMRSLGNKELKKKLDTIGFTYMDFILYGQQTWMKDGKGIAENYFEDFCYIMNLNKKHVKTLEELWQGAYEKTWIIKGMSNLVKRLKENYKIGLLSNCGLKLKQNFESKETSKYFDEKIYSFEEYIIKPNPNIYCRMLQKLKVTPFQAVFIDDIPRFVDGARYLGINSILFRDKTVKDLENELGDLGVKL